LIKHEEKDVKKQAFEETDHNNGWRAKETS